MSRQNFIDSGEGAFFQRELELMKPQLYTVAYPAMMHAVALPLSVDKDPAATNISYKMFDILGVAKIIANYADDLPRADVKGKEFFLKVHTLGMSAGWSKFELAAGMKTGRPIEQANLASAKESIMRLADKLAFLGDSTVGIYGLTNIPSMPNTVVATSGGATTWAAKIALGTQAGRDAILTDLNTMFSRMSVSTKNCEVPDTLALAPSSFQQISSTPRSDGSDLTILEFFLKAHPGLVVIQVPHLETSGTGGVKQAILYRRDASKLELEIPEDVVVHPIEQRGLEYIVAVTMRFAGVLAKYPLSLDSAYGM